MKPNYNVMVDLSDLARTRIKFADLVDIVLWMYQLKPGQEANLAFHKCYKLTRVKNTVKVELIEDKP